MAWYTQEEIKAAGQILTIDYLRRCEPGRLKKCRYLRHEYELVDHDSFKINENSSIWHWKSRDIGGKYALKFLQVVDGMSFPEAMGILQGEFPHYVPVKAVPEEKERIPFTLPERAQDNRRIWRYLRDRGISREVFAYCADLGILYESAPYHNAVFVGKDEQGIPRYAFLRGTYEKAEKPFKRERGGSDKAYSFCIPPLGKSCRVAVYEAAIETLAHMTLEGNRADKWRLSLGGIYAPKDETKEYHPKKPLALEHFLKIHPEIKEIEICTNNDPPGRKKEKFLKELQKWQVSENQQKLMSGIVPWIQRHEFLEAKEIHWQANVWYLERIHIAKERVNQSSPAGSLVFEDVKDRGNRELLKKYMRYLIAVSDLSASNVRGKSIYVRNFLKFLDEKEVP